jgi:hypothetical protein
VTAAAREVASLAAAMGTNFTLDLLTEASDLDADIVVGAVDELWRRRIIHEFRDGYDFSHDMLRETAYTQVSPPSSMPGAGDLSGPWPTTGARLMSQRACSPMPRRSGCTARRCRSSGRGLRG